MKLIEEEFAKSKPGPIKGFVPTRGPRGEEAVQE